MPTRRSLGLASGLSRRVAAVAQLAVVVVLGVAPAGASADTVCADRWFRFEVASADGSHLVERMCAVTDLLEWAALTPAPRADFRPTEALGPRFIVVITAYSSNGSQATLRQDLYPLAAGGPLAFSAPRQIFDHASFGGRYMIPSGWIRIDPTGPVATIVRESGVPLRPFAWSPSSGDVVPWVASPEPEPAASRVSETVDARDTPRSIGPDAVTVLFGLVLVAGVLWFLHRR